MSINKEILLQAEDRYLGLGLNINTMGFKYLCQATVLCYMTYYLSRVSQHTFYREVADMHGISYSSVERSMRYAIEEAYEEDEDRFSRTLFKLCRKQTHSRPAPMILIRYVARDIAVETGLGF